MKDDNNKKKKDQINTNTFMHKLKVYQKCAHAHASQIDLTHQNFIYRNCNQHKHPHKQTNKQISLSIRMQHKSVNIPHITRISWRRFTYYFLKYLPFFYHLEMLCVASGLCLNHQRVFKSIMFFTFIIMHKIYTSKKEIKMHFEEKNEKRMKTSL